MWVHQLFVQCVSVTVLLLLLLPSYTEQCGITTHLEVAYRTREHFDLIVDGVDYGDLLSRHEGAFQAGASYPDAFYPGFCYRGQYHDVAEDTHWTPFLTSAVSYIRARYPQPWGRAQQKLVVFLLSIVTHQVSDATWHSLGIDQGFLQAMAKTNYHNSFGDAHSAGDFGGDVVNQYNMDTEYIGRLLQWYVPTEDLVGIYDEYYNATVISEEIIETCSQWIFLGRLGESIGVIELLYPLYARGSTFLIDRLGDYFLGGLDDMAVWCGNTWQRTIYMLHNGTDVCDTPDNPIYIRCDNEEEEPSTSNRRKRRDLQSMLRQPLAGMHANLMGVMEARIAAAGLTAEDVTIQRDDGGIYLSPGPKLQKLVNDALKIKYALTEETRDANDTVVQPSAFYTSANMLERLGESMISGDLNNDGWDDLIVSAPGLSSSLNYMQGAVYVIYGSEDGLPEMSLDIHEAAGQILLGSELNGRFGTSLSIVDINKDGLNDLAVSAPTVGSPQLDYQGEVYIFYGKEEGGVVDQPSITISCQQRYCNLGWSLSGEDVDGDGFRDLNVGSPFAPAGGEQRGMVAVLLAKEVYEATGALYLTDVDFDWTFTGEQDYEWLGYSVSGYRSTTDGSGSWIIAGAPMARICARPDCEFDSEDIQAVGRVYVFEGPGFDSTFPTQPSAVYQGENNFEQFGFHVTAGLYRGKETLVISAATQSVEDDGEGGDDSILQAGQVTMYELNTVRSDEQRDERRDEPVYVFTGDRAFGRFGAKVIFADVDGDGENEVIITAPLRSESFRDTEESGRAFVFSATQEERNRTPADADMLVGMLERNARFGYSAASVGPSIVFGAPHYNSDFERLAGGVAIYHLNRETP